MQALEEDEDQVRLEILDQMWQLLFGINEQDCAKSIKVNKDKVRIY